MILRTSAKRRQRRLAGSFARPQGRHGSDLPSLLPDLRDTGLANGKPAKESRSSNYRQQWVVSQELLVVPLGHLPSLTSITEHELLPGTW